jgi:predicted nucleic acid-binding protein
MKDIVLDTDILVDFLSQYFGDFRETKCFSPFNNMNSERVRIINEIIKAHEQHRKDRSYIFASTFAFVEISRKFDKIVDSRFNVEQFGAFIDQPPEWFLISPVESSLFLQLLNIPARVKMPAGKFENIEWADAIHLATAMSRENCFLATTDLRIRQVPIFKDNII